jgi:hypothetical protein
MCALAAHNEMDWMLAERLMKIARGITSTCHESYDRSATKLGPDSFRDAYHICQLLRDSNLIEIVVLSRQKMTSTKCEFFLGVLQFITQTGEITPLGVFSKTFPVHKMQVH